MKDSKGGAALPKVVAVIGPTASGKTALGIFLCQRFGGEIISADAKQVYKGMDIGTAKEVDAPVPQHLIDIKDPGETITVAEYQQLAYGAIDDLLERGKLPVLVGGSGLYAESVLRGYQFAEKGKSDKHYPRYESLLLGIEIGREALKQRAKERLLERVNQGLVEEVAGLLGAGVSPEWLWRCGIEYRYMSLHVLGKLSLDEAITKTITATNQFIKRQYTWWRRHETVKWISSHQEAERLVEAFLNEDN